MDLTQEQIEQGLRELKYMPVEKPNKGTGRLPYVTHEGVLQLGEFKIKSFILNTGDRVFDAEDFQAFAKAFFGEDFVEMIPKTF